MTTSHPTSRRKSSVLATAAAVVLVAVATVVALSATPAAGGDPPAPAAAADQLPPPSGDADTDAALVRCARAVQRGHSTDRYPPFATWRSTKYERVGAAESELTVGDAFVCALTPDSVILSGTPAPGESGVRLVRMSPGKLVALNPGGARFTVGAGRESQEHTERVSVVQLRGGAAIGDVRLTVDGTAAGDAEPVPAQVVVDRGLELRTPDTDGPDSRHLGECLARLPASTYTDPNLWGSFGGTDPGTSAPHALVAGIGGLFVGYCVYDPAAGPTFVGAPRPAPTARPQPIVAHHGRAGALLITLPSNEGNRVEIAPAAGSGGAQDCWLLDHMAMCTLRTPHDPAFVVTAFTAQDPQGVEVYQG
jgi:hypothetical protein